MDRPTRTITVTIPDCSFTNDERLALDLAITVAARLPMHSSAASCCDYCGPAIVDEFSALADQLDCDGRREALRQLEQLDEAFKRGPREVGTLAPSDIAMDYYLPQITAAYFVGLAMGLRLARAGELLTSSAS